MPTAVSPQAAAATTAAPSQPLTFTVVTTVDQLNQTLNELLTADLVDTSKTHVLPFIALSADAGCGNGIAATTGITGNAAPPAAVSRFNPIAFINIMNHGGTHAIRCDLRAIMASANNNANSDQQEQHPLTSLLRLLNGNDFAKIVADGRGIQDAIATDLATFDTALLSHVVDLSILPIFFGYEDRYQPRFQRGVLRLPSLREAAAFLHVAPRPLPAQISINGAAPQLVKTLKVSAEPISAALTSAGTAAGESSSSFIINYVLEQLNTMRTIADNQLRHTLFRTAITPNTNMYRLQKQQKAVVKATQLMNTLRKQNNNSNSNGNSNANDGGAATTTRPRRLTRQEIENAVNACYTTNAAVTMEDSSALVTLALDDVLSASRRFIDILGSYQHPALNSNNGNNNGEENSTSTNNATAAAATMADARAHLAALLDTRKANYLPFGVIQPLANNTANSNSNLNINTGGDLMAATSTLLAKQKIILEASSHKHQQFIDQQRRAAAYASTRSNNTLSQAVADILGDVHSASSAATSGATPAAAGGGNSRVSAAADTYFAATLSDCFAAAGKSSHGGAAKNSTATAGSIATVRTVVARGGGKHGKKGGAKAVVESSGAAFAPAAAAAAATSSPSSAATEVLHSTLGNNPNRPVDVVKHCSVCYLPFNAKVSPHQAKRDKSDASASNALGAICTNCVEKALPCEFFRRGCCFRLECDYAHAHIPCPFGAQCISYAVERFTREQQQQQMAATATPLGNNSDLSAAGQQQQQQPSAFSGFAKTSTSSVASSSGNHHHGASSASSSAMMIAQQFSAHQCGCCPFTHPGEKGYAAPAAAAAETGNNNSSTNAKHVDPTTAAAAPPSTSSFTVRSPTTDNSRAPSLATAAAVESSTAAASTDAASSSSSISTLFQPTLVNPLTGLAGAGSASTRKNRRLRHQQQQQNQQQGGVAAGEEATASASATMEGNNASASHEANNETNSVANTSMTSKSAVTAATASSAFQNSRKRMLCVDHFYSAMGCPRGTKCRFSHTPIPLYVPIPIVAATTTTTTTK